MAREDEPQAGIIYKEAQSIMVDELPELWLWEKFYPIANSDGLVGPRQAPCIRKVCVPKTSSV